MGALQEKPGRAPSGGSAALGRLAPGEVEQEPECAVDRLGVLEGLRHVGIEQDHVGALLIALVVLAAHRREEVILGLQVVVFRLYSAFFSVRWPLWH